MRAAALEVRVVHGGGEHVDEELGGSAAAPWPPGTPCGGSAGRARRRGRTSPPPRTGSRGSGRVPPGRGRAPRSRGSPAAAGCTSGWKTVWIWSREQDLLQPAAVLEGELHLLDARALPGLLHQPGHQPLGHDERIEEDEREADRTWRAAAQVGRGEAGELAVQVLLDARGGRRAGRRPGCCPRGRSAWGDRKMRKASPPRSFRARRSVFRTSMPRSSTTSSVAIERTFSKALEP